LADALKPQMEDGPMDFREFLRILEAFQLLNEPLVVMFAIIRLQEPALAEQYMSTVKNITEILNTPLPTMDCWLIHRACWEGCVPMVEALIEYGINTDRLNQYNEDPPTCVENAHKFGQYGVDQMTDLKLVLQKAKAKKPPPPAPPRPSLLPGPAFVRAAPEATHAQQAQQQQPYYDQTAHSGGAAYAGAQHAQSAYLLVPVNDQPAENAAKFVNSFSLDGSSSWLKNLHPSATQTHCVVTRIAFEASINDVVRLFASCGEIVGIHMPMQETAKSGFQKIIGEKLGQSWSHKGKAIIRFKTQQGYNNALLLHGAEIAYRPIEVSSSGKKAKAAAAAKSGAQGLTKSFKTQQEKKESTSRKRKKRTKQKKSGTAASAPDQTVQTGPLLPEQQTAAEAAREAKAQAASLPEAEPQKAADNNNKAPGWLSVLETGSEQCHVHVAGIPFEFTTKDVRELFQKCGQVIDVYMPSASSKSANYDHIASRLAAPIAHKGKAIVLYKTKFSSYDAVKNLDGHEVLGRNISVSQTARKNKKKQQAKKASGGAKAAPAAEAPPDAQAGSTPKHLQHSQVSDEPRGVLETPAKVEIESVQEVKKKAEVWKRNQRSRPPASTESNAKTESRAADKAEERETKRSKRTRSPSPEPQGTPTHRTSAKAQRKDITRGFGRSFTTANERTKGNHVWKTYAARKLTQQQHEEESKLDFGELLRLHKQSKQRN